ncbi:MAG TPA: hypothetical protein VF591_23155 [Pyrinomonadaceae bacterium]|jgi:hypothetical protein
MKNALYALLLVLLAASAPPAAFAQDGGAKMVDEFGDILVTDWLARLDSFAVELQNSPGATGYVVAYMAPHKAPGWPLRRSRWARGYLIRGRGFDEGRVQVFNGGYRDEHLYQLWLVEPGAKLPVAPFDLGAALAREKKAYLFDQYAYYDINPDETGIEYGYIGYLDEKGHYASFADALRQDPAARGCVIAYATRRQRRGSDRLLAARVKLGLLRSHALGADRVVALGGGRRGYKMVELWLVPPGAALPEPSPAPRTTRRR